MLSIYAEPHQDEPMITESLLTSFWAYLKSLFEVVEGLILQLSSTVKTSGSDWLNTDQAASHLQVTPECIRNMASDGQIPFYKLGRRNRYKRSELDSLLNSTRLGGFNGN